MIFPKLIQEDILQVDDKTRFDMGESFATPEEGGIIDVEIGFDDVTYISIYAIDEPEKWYLDYAFDTDGDKDVWVRVTTAIGNTKKQFSITIISEVDDALFSKDSQLFAQETELKSYFPKGKCSFKYAHRLAQRNIIRYLEGEGIRKLVDGKKVSFTKDDLVNDTKINEWSTYETLMLVFEDLRVKDKDVFEEKKKSYTTKHIDARKNALLNLDFNGDGEIEDTEIKNVQSKFLTR